MSKELEDLKNANVVLKSINKAALKIGLDKTCCGNCKYIWLPECKFPDDNCEHSVCKNHEFDGKTYQERLLK